MLDFGLDPALRSVLMIRTELNGKMTERLQVGNVTLSLWFQRSVFLDIDAEIKAFRKGL
jgi:hypothetical protein